MNQITKEQLKQYFKQIKLLFPIYGKDEKRFLSDFQVTVEEYVEHHSDCSLNDVVERFGEAEDVVHDYITTLDQSQLCKRINLRNVIKKVLILIAIFAAVIFAYRFYLLNELYQQAQENMLSYVVQVIE